MTTTLAPYRFFLIVFIVLLVACGTLAPGGIASTPPMSATDVNSTALSGAFTEVAQTLAAMPTLTAIPTDTVLTPIPTLTALPFMALDGLRVAYIIGGNLYVQDSGKPAIQLTRSGQDRSPIFSDDGQKIVFSRESDTEMNQLHVINADGTGERAVGTPDLLSGDYRLTEPHSVVFVPGTHLLLFNTYGYSDQSSKTNGSHPNVMNDLLFADTDTGEIRQLVAIGQGGFFLVSPNGKWIAVQTPDHVDVIDLQGRFILRNLMSHSRDSYDCVFYGYICAPMYWTQDSNQLILVEPCAAGCEPTPRSIWRYPIDGSSGIEIKLNPSPMYDAFAISPDGNWFLYSYDRGSLDPQTPNGIYLGNLHDGTSQLLYGAQPDENTGFVDVPLYYEGWSPDSVNFVFHDDDGRFFMGNIHGEIAPLERDVSAWINNTQYLTGITLHEVGNRGGVQVVKLPPGIYLESIEFVFLKR